MTNLTQSTEQNVRGLPVHPLILLPDGRVFLPSSSTQLSNCLNTEDTFIDILDNQCFSSALHHAIHNPRPPLSNNIRRPDAISWLNLELNPSLMNDVVSVIMPVIGWTKTEPVVLPISSDSACYVEMHHSMQHWRLTQLLNLRLIIAVPWPDLIPFHGRTDSEKRHRNQYIELGSYAKRGIHVTLIPNLFEESTQDLLITLLISTLKGLGKDSDRSLDIYLDLIDTYAPLTIQPPFQHNASPHLQVPKRRLTTTTGAQATLTLPKPPSPPPQSATAPPTSLTLATNRCGGGGGAFSAGGGASRYVIRADSEINPNRSLKPLRESVVGFVGLASQLALQTAILLKVGHGMRVIYHQQYPLSEAWDLEFVDDLRELLQQSDVVILTDDLSPQRHSLAKAVRPRSPVRHKPQVRRSHLSLQDSDFENFSPSAVFISTSSVQSFSFSALVSALRNQKLAGAGFIIPLDGSLASSDLQALYHLDNVIIVAPPANPGCSPKQLRRTLAALVLQTLSDHLGFASLCPAELPPIPSSRLFSRLTASSRAPTNQATNRSISSGGFTSRGLQLGRRLSSRIQSLLSELIETLRPLVGRGVQTQVVSGGVRGHHRIFGTRETDTPTNQEKESTGLPSEA